VAQKRTWIDRSKTFGYDFPAIFQKDKHLLAGPRRLLIDDTQSKIDKWNEAGGVGHLFTTYENCLNFIISCDDRNDSNGVQG